MNQNSAANNRPELIATYSVSDMLLHISTSICQEYESHEIRPYEKGIHFTLLPCKSGQWNLYLIKKYSYNEINNGSLALKIDNIASTGLKVEKRWICLERILVRNPNRTFTKDYDAISETKLSLENSLFDWNIFLIKLDGLFLVDGTVRWNTLYPATITFDPQKTVVEIRIDDVLSHPL